MSDQQMIAELEALRAENAQLKVKNTKAKSGLKVSVKKAISLYGMQRFPVTLYAAGWAKLLVDHGRDIAEFIIDNQDQVEWKDEAERAKSLTLLATFLMPKQTILKQA